jgi:hypothetical protein
MKLLPLLFSVVAFGSLLSPVYAVEHKGSKECNACCKSADKCDACCHDKGKGVECKECCSRK